MFKKIFSSMIFILIAVFLASAVMTGCKGKNKGAGDTLVADPVEPGSGDGGQTVPGTDTGGVHPIFSGQLGVPISKASMGAIDPDPTGLNASNDYDGDGITNDREITTNKFVADYPKVVARVAVPITMEIRVSESSELDNHSETVTEKDVKDTITNSMEDKHYESAQQKTTPYVTKESLSNSGSHADSYGYNNSDSYSTKDQMNIGGSFNAKYGTNEVGVSLNYGQDKERSKSTGRSENSSISDSFASATMSEKTVFQDVDYVDNMDRNGVEFTSKTVENMSTNYRKDTKIHNNESIGPNAGYVRASLFLKNLSVNMPVHISNVICTLSFRTPSGQFLSVRTFKLRNEDYSEFNQDVYGDEELGPYTIEISDLNTREVRLALANGYIPQIHVVSYDTTRVSDSNYNPGVENLKIVEETAKGRTALVKIIGINAREIHRVAAFDVVSATGNTGAISPGISLKKALFNTLRDYIGDGETWGTDRNGAPLTVADTGLKWKAGVSDKTQYAFGSNLKGNSWRNLETYVKSYEKNGKIYRIETIKRIGILSKYNPFSKEDNSNYSPNELLSRDEVLKMKFWVIFHNGRYFEGDLNDPIWAGDRYEIVCMDMMDYNERVTNYVYTPFQSGNRFYMDSRWNSLSEQEGEFARAMYLGKVLPSDVIRLEVNLMESRFLFNEGQSMNGFGIPASDSNGSIFYNYNYTMQPTAVNLNGIPDAFTYQASGGVNSIWLNIKQAVNAHSYRIVFTELVPPAGQTAVKKTVLKSRSDIEKTGGFIIVTSKTLDINSSEVGLISGTPQAAEGGTEKGYKVEIWANGTLNGISVYTKGDSTSNLAYVSEPDPDDHSPKAFAFAANGSTDSIAVHIAGANDTEYYVIKCKGPYNYYTEPNVPTETIIAYPGYNEILFSDYPSLRPAFESLEGKNFQSGTYTVDVYAVNRYNAGTVAQCDEFNTPGNCVQASNGTVFAEAKFDRYAEQRKYAPRTSKNLFDLSAVDFEVNFNDGSGWLKLQVVDPFTYGAQSNDPSKVIDCYYSSYMENDEQKFFIEFMAPGGQWGLPNVFFGGRTEAKVFLRVIPKQKYRDTFWPIIGVNSSTGNPIPRTTYEDEKIYLDFNMLSFASDFNIVDFWLSSAQTDASIFETTVNQNSINGFSDASRDCMLGKTGTNTEKYDDFFFSPKEHRVYVVKAIAESDKSIQTPYRPVSPAFASTPPFPQYQPIPPSYTYNNIALTGIYSSHATGYDIYWVEGAITIDANSQTWQTNTAWKGNATIENRNYYTINQLNFNQVYTIAVAARNKYGTSAPTVRQIAVPNLPAALPAMPTGVVQVDQNGIYVHNISSNNAVTLMAYWKLQSRGQDNEPVNDIIWQNIDVVSGALLIPQENILTAIDETGIPSDKVVLRVIPFNSDNATGPYWQEVITPYRTFTVTYNGNGNTSGSVPIDTYTYSQGANVTLLQNIGNLLKIDGTTTAYRFLTWNTAADGSGPDYAEGTNFTIGYTDIILYAKWAPYALRDIGPAGGWVFYDKGTYSDGWRYMEAAPYDQSTGIRWWNGSNVLIGTTELTIGSGLDNTAEIVNMQGSGVYAAQICNDLAIGGYTDWFLPSRDECTIMYQTLGAYGTGNFYSQYYWTSTESVGYINNVPADYSDSCVVNIYNGERTIVSKSQLSRARAARRF